ncbi:MAG: hypothetical protein ACTS22_03620 [Phycisphaerales bacterium]
MTATGGTLFGPEPSRDASDEAIVAAYAQTGRTLDDLPYTPEFESLLELVLASDPVATHRGVFHRLHTLRKSGKLVRLGRAASSPPRLSEEHETLLVDLVITEAGSLGQRDRLPYTDGFDRVAGVFAAQTGLQLTHHDLWRVIAKLAK